jgi:hypothetical protein
MLGDAPRNRFFLPRTRGSVRSPIHRRCFSAYLSLLAERGASDHRPNPKVAGWIEQDHGADPIGREEVGMPVCRITGRGIEILREAWLCQSSTVSRVSYQ